MSAIRRHRQGGGFHEAASDAELDRVFGLDRSDPPKHGDLLLIKGIPDPRVAPHSVVLARCVELDSGSVLQFFGTEWTCRLDQVTVVQKVTAVWV